MWRKRVRYVKCLVIWKAIKEKFKVSLSENNSERWRKNPQCKTTDLYREVVSAV